jgi:hypothetical protein
VARDIGESRSGRMRIMFPHPCPCRRARAEWFVAIEKESATQWPRLQIRAVTLRCSPDPFVGRASKGDGAARDGTSARHRGHPSRLARKRARAPQDDAAACCRGETMRCNGFATNSRRGPWASIAHGRSSSAAGRLACQKMQPTPFAAPSVSVAAAWSPCHRRHAGPGRYGEKGSLTAGPREMSSPRGRRCAARCRSPCAAD